jgi:hypothetical protein
MEQIECTQCHGEVKADKPGSTIFCLRKSSARNAIRAKQYGEGRRSVCRTAIDRTKDLKLDGKVLYCHSNNENIRKELKEDAPWMYGSLHPML